MTFATLRNSPVFLRMAGGAFQFGMLAGLFLQTCRHPTMADPALPFKLGGYRNTRQRLVRILVTVKAFKYRLSLTMGSIMAAAALGHDLRIVVPQRIISMEDFMAFGAEHAAVFCAIILDPVEM